MLYLDCNEQIQHRTGATPLAYYYVDEHHPRYHMRPHWHRETELIRIRSGRFHGYIDDVEVHAEPGDLLLLGEGVVHGGEPEDSVVYECIVFDPYTLLMHIDPCRQQLKPLLSRTQFLKNGSIVRYPVFRSALEMLYENVRAGVEGRELSILGTLFLVCANLPEVPGAVLRDTVASRSGLKAEQIKPALEYIERHYGQRITLDELARLTGFSPKYFCRCFRAVIHRSPIDYLNYYRVECAGDLLTSSEMTVAEIAQHCGYNDSSFFIKQFRRYKGATPRQYRASVGRI